MSSDVWSEVVATEEAIAELSPALRDLERAILDLSLPDVRAREHFAPVVEVRDLSAWPETLEPLAGARVPVRGGVIPASPPTTAALPALALWRPLLDRVDYFEHARLAVEDGELVGGVGSDLLRTTVRFGAAARLLSGERVGLQARVSLEWTSALAAAGAEGSPWRIREMATGPVEVLAAPGPLFRETLANALPDPGERAAARRSLHEALARERLLHPGAFRAPHRHFFLGSQDRHPAVSVADVDGDGWDDLYVMPRFGRNQLLRNRGDGTFEERAAALGLDLADHSTGAIFADFDNDGDVDVFIGRSLAPSVHLENVNGRFRPVPTPEPLPRLVGSLSAADVDGDGLLDVYVATYAAQMLVAEMAQRRRRARELGVPPPPGLLADYLPEADALRLEQETRRPDAHPYLDLPGPPNVLLRNVGGRFERDRRAPELEMLRNTYQAAWSDYDLDGDPDVYLAHDFAPNQLLRNEGGGRFTDVTEATGTADIGFGMGVGWGDYDGDGRFDLYVSNMFSKAGRRITGRVEGADARLSKMARGNTLFRNLGERFEPVSSRAPEALAVERAGWSWGGQFVDVDNDGWLDVYALSGYYTSPLDPDTAPDT